MFSIVNSPSAAFPVVLPSEAFKSISGLCSKTSETDSAVPTTIIIYYRVEVPPTILVISIIRYSMKDVIFPSVMYPCKYN